MKLMSIRRDDGPRFGPSTIDLRSFDKDSSLMRVVTATVAVVAFAVLLLIWGCEEGMASRLAREDGLIENLTALFYLSGCLICVFRLAKVGKKSVFLLILWAFLCLVFLGEEISWGQRIFHFETPSKIAEINQQKEFNLHNLTVFEGGEWRKFFNSGQFSPKMILGTQNLFNLGFFCYFLLLPLVLRAPLFSSITTRIDYRAPRTFFVVSVFLVIGLSYALVFFSGKVHIDALAETREMLYALFILFYIWTHLQLRPAAPP